MQADHSSGGAHLANTLDCTVLLKGSGSIIASPGEVPHINPTGNALLATGGTGDVLAGMVAARWGSMPNGMHRQAHHAACAGVCPWGHCRWLACAAPFNGACLGAHVGACLLSISNKRNWLR